MELLQAEISRKRKATAALIDQASPQLTAGKTRFVRRGDLKHIEEQKQRDQQRELDAKRDKTALKEAPEEESERVRTLRESASDKAAVLDSLMGLDVKEIKRRLRQLRRPVTLFGETEEERVTRLSVVLSEDVEDDEYRLTANYSTKNTFLGSRLEKERGLNKREEDEDEDEEDGPSVQSKNSNLDTKKTDEDGEEEHDDEGNVEGNRKSGGFVKGDIKTTYSSTPGLSNQKIIYKYFRNLLKQWEWDLDDRDDVVKRTAKGKMETRTQKQCKDYIRPLFKLCKNDDIPWDISEKLVKIVTACENGDFRLAHDIYLQAAIGKAAWPIGLTMVGIHERSGREKISTSKVAHVMNNELQRKYFTSVKRLMTYAQTKRSDVNPSMKSL